MDFILLIGNAIITTIITISILLASFVISIYVISAFKLVFWSIRTKIFKNYFMWLNPLKLIEYSGVVTTLSTDECHYIINYQGLIPRCKVITK